MGPDRVRFSFDGAPLEAARGMTIGGALLANGILSWRRTSVTGRPRGIFCGTGSDIGAAVAGGARDVRAVREVTRCGTGYCQARVCGPALTYALSAT